MRLKPLSPGHQKH